ncbi:metalloregulator ArsR/SmtB family transcription factor [Anaerotalea alkaliphila]|uniref:Winged helix-turn-helix transcriptional regulator n=1 Tax=Anaerotalea alkaliphila TaxID=2662126 RepID=A0A7X5HWT6_9FIRM|nr:winged helix-turn-helix transcriptional regulator [Anaerotalea alkaliphila]
MNIQNFEEVAELLKMMGHPARLCILIGLLDKEGCNVSYMQSCLNIPQSTVSQHLAKLKSAGIIKGERHGLEIKYSVVNEDVIKIIQALSCEHLNEPFVSIKSKSAENNPTN